MILYHGSLETVATPRIMQRAFYRPLDFGTGFYATSSRDQAVRWVRNRLDYDAAAPRGCVNVYEFDEPGFAAIRRMKTYRLANQFLFHTEAALRFLSFRGAEEVAR